MSQQKTTSAEARFVHNEISFMHTIPLSHNQSLVHQSNCYMTTGALVFAAGWIMMTASTFAASLDHYWLGTTMGASVMVSAFAFFLQSKAEARKIVIGRFLGAILLGVFGSRFMWHYSDWVKNLSVDPIMVAGIGSAHAFVGYMTAAAIVDWWERRAKGLVERGLRWGVDLYMPPAEKVDPKDLRSSASSRNNHRKP